MRLRPSTPLSVLLAVAFAFLLLAVLSTPVIQAIPLGQFKDYKFGALGFCQPDGKCSSIGIGYDSGNALSDNNDAFDMPSGVRQTLSTVLVLHPVAAVLVLIMLLMAIASHFHAPSHSSRFLLAFFIFTIISFLVCLAAFVIDVLLFIPNMAWGSYIVLAATIVVGGSGVVTCGMRRSLISRKARRKKIAENAEMSGENYYNREAHDKPLDFSTPGAIPLTGGANGAGNDALPAFATFEHQKDDQVSDERIPLTQTSPSTRSPSNRVNDMASTGEVAAMNAPHRPPSQDRYGNPTNGPPDGYGVARGPSMESMRSRGSQQGYRGRGGYGGRGGYDMYGAPMRGRGGYGPPGRGGYPPRGRGGLGPPPRGAYGPGPMRGGRSPPPPGYGGYHDGRTPPPADAYGPYGRRPSDGYNTNPSTNPSMPSVNAGYEPYSMEGSNYPRAESPPPMPGSESRSGKAVEMDATPAEQGQGYTPYNGRLRDNDSDVAGMVGLQQQSRPPDKHDTYMSEGSKYSSDEQQYMPARAAWAQGEGRNSPRTVSPLNVAGRPGGRNTPQPGPQGDYYEDVDPRFAGAPAPPGNYQPPPIEPVYEDVHASNSGARSPAESERSNFTSISQRGVNPRWNQQPPMPHQRGPPPSRPAQQRQDMLLDNPDFQVPGNRPGGGPQPGGPGVVPGSAYPGRPL